ncbi:nuclear transcription factor Y subunit B-6 isoform X2 [Diospyros lotus]|uniref:nuclear transcription factor Y subunit B-6 isoform X2 n=1 Tax=Diospyros lotus TaxID=55363 RepID=UPI0022521843|nr:nuclear transcription factor Y subunit B-6 isoform X2 [Diospyros lotus]
MERGGTGGFHGYRRTPQTSPGLKLPEINMSHQADRQILVNDNTNNTGMMNNHSSSSNNPVAVDDSGNECTVREQDRFMPIANVIRIMRKMLPPHAKISDDAKETIQECVSEFISFITGEANERCQREQRKTITAEDVLWAMSKLGFDDYIEPLTVYLNRYREFEGDRGSIRGDIPLAVMKRTMDLVPSSTSTAAAAFAPVFHLGHHHGFFGAPPPPAAAAAGGMAGFLNDAISPNNNNAAAAAGSSQPPAVASIDQSYARICNK